MPRPKQSDSQEQPVKKKERYFRVRFHAKSNANDPNDVHLAVNGETLCIKREKEVIIPERFVECANHAVYPQFQQLPGKSRKIVAHVKTFPFDNLGEASEEEFLEMRSSGTQRVRHDLEVYGMDGDLD